MNTKCPGQDIRNLRAVMYKCPNCGNEVEMFSDELRIKCRKCGEYVYKEKTPVIFMSHQNSRRLKVEFMLGILDKTWKAGKQVDEKKFLSMICLKFGAGERYIKEILKQLETLNIIHRGNGVISKGQETMQSTLT